MGMTANFKILTESEYSGLRAKKLEVEEVLFPDGVENPFEGRVDLDKNWHILHYLLTGDVNPSNSALGSAILGGEEIGEDLGYGPARLLLPNRVAEISTALSDIDIAINYESIDREDPNISELYCTFEFFDGEKEYLVKLFKEMSSMYAEASNTNSAVIAYLA
jgi:hypothetical protein